ncbi:solute carrier family 7 member 13 [Pteropus vampyrus]|uniref:Solute carrier family 7 member 13 n=1 Tax=Pteropus vampyrus TaxID=132908 RepID=A0A6P3R2W2_PTEVA|nr:solute carrier family 7 member 13 [Pteropus vampyrus]
MDGEKKIQLKRVFGYSWGTSFVMVKIIGAGIFVAPAGVLKYCRMNVGLSLCVWAACSLLALMDALCSAEIGITFPCSGAHYYFLLRCFGSCVSFLNLWTGLFLGAAVIASQALLLAQYSIQPFYPSCPVPGLPMRCLALAFLWVVGILSSRGVREVAWLQMASTVLKMAILGLVSVSGVVLLARGREENVASFRNAFQAEYPDASQLIQAVFQGYFAYLGGGCLTYIAGELENPRRTILKCILTALPLVTVLYLLVNVSYLAVLTPREILSSGPVAVAWTHRVLPALAWVVPFGISTSLFSSLLMNVFQSSRVAYTAGREGQLPALFTMLNRHSSPFPSVLLLVTMASIAVVSMNLIDLINYLNFAASIWTVLSMIGILKLRYQEPDLPRPYKVFLPFPLVTMAIGLCLVVIPLVKSPHMHYVYVCLFILSGLLFYVPFIYFKLKLAGFQKMTCYLQLLFNICIPDVSDEQMSEAETVKKK